MLAKIKFDIEAFKNNYGVIYTQEDDIIAGRIDKEHQSWKNTEYEHDDIVYVQQEYSTGVIVCSDFNFNHIIDSKTNYETINDFFFVDKNTGEIYQSIFDEELGVVASTYGVCDTIDEAILYFEACIANKKHEYCIVLSPVYRKNQPPDHGWRYHKWGTYIGTQNPQHEYLYDDKHIDMLYCFNLYVVREK